MRNVERLRKLADHIKTLGNREEASENAFDMESYCYGDCGAPSCIAGWAVWMFDPSPRDIRSCSVFRRAKDILSLSLTEAEELFKCQGVRDLEWELIGPKAAAEVIEHFAETGVVDWSDEVERQKPIIKAMIGDGQLPLEEDWIRETGTVLFY